METRRPPSARSGPVIYREERAKSALELPSMGQGVKTHSPCPPGDRPLAPGARPHRSRRWRPFSDRAAEREPLRARWVREASEHRSARASSVTSKPSRSPALHRERSFHQGLWGPSLCSALEGGIPYAWGLRTARSGTRNSTDAHPQPTLVSGICARGTDAFASLSCHPETRYVVVNRRES
jgi:hypothetical protein